MDTPIITDKNNLTERQRSHLVATLWKLKQTLTKFDSHQYIDFSLLMQDEHYREQVLTRATQSTVPEVREIAYTAKSLNRPGKLIDRKEVQRLTSMETVLTAEAEMSHYVPGPYSSYRSYSPRYFLGFGMSALLIMLLGSTLGYFVVVNKDNMSNPPFNNAVEITDAILKDTLWTHNNTYYLNSVIFVEGSAKLTIEPGTQILGKPGSALIITRDASIYARGKSDAPILFSSAAPAGKRRAGDWGGIVLLGSAPVNQANPHIEGIDKLDSRGQFGGNDRNSNCGVIEYTRIEFAGYEVYANNELNGLTLGGCGDSTIIRHVQVHRALDDGIEVFGGTVWLDHIIVTGAQDDGFDWDMGWQGGVQYLIVQHYPEQGDNALEGDNNKQNPQAEPRSTPTFSNVTLIGAAQSDKKQRAMVLREGSGGHFMNFIASGFTGELIDIRGQETVAAVKKGLLTLAGFLVDKVGPGGIYYPMETTTKEDDDGGFDEKAFLSAPERRLTLANADLTNPFDLANPSFTPSARSPANTNAATIPQGEFWDEAANFLGAIRPGATATWLAGWTAYPEQ